MENKHKLLENFLFHFPIKLRKSFHNYSDNNLTCFAPIEKIIRKPLLLSKFKKMLDHIISLETNEDYFSELFEAKLSNRLIYDITNINRNEYIKTKICIPNLKKVKFNINLYNIINYSLAGINIDRRFPKNLKTLQYTREVSLSILLIIFSGKW